MTQEYTPSGICCGSEDPAIEARPLNLDIVSDFISVLDDNQPLSIGEVAEIFEIDDISRKKHGNILVKDQKKEDGQHSDDDDDQAQTDTENGEDRTSDTGDGKQGGQGSLRKKRASSLFNINKGLALEKLAVYFMYHINSPVYSRSNCMMHRESGLPVNFAPRDTQDGIVDYGDYRVSLEVSAKTDMGKKDFKNQLEGGLNHARDGGFDIFMLVTEWGPETPGAKAVLEDFRKNHAKELENIDLICVSTTTLHTIGSELCNDYEFKQGEKRITEDNMKAVFKALAAGAFEYEEDTLKESMVNIWLNVLETCWNSEDAKPESQPPSPE